MQIAEKKTRKQANLQANAQAIEPALQHCWVADEADLLAGKWVSGSGELYCRWAWQANHCTLTVTAAGMTDRRRFDVTPQMLAANHLPRVFPEIARQTARRLRTQAEQRGALLLAAG